MTTRNNTYLLDAIKMLLEAGFYLIPNCEQEPIDGVGIPLSDADEIYDLTQEVDDFVLEVYNEQHDYLGWLYGVNVNDDDEWLSDYTCGPQSEPFSSLLDKLDY